MEAVEAGACVRTLIIRLFSPVGTEASRLRGLVQQPGCKAVPFLGADELVAVVEALGNADEARPTGPRPRERPAALSDL